MEFVSCPSCGAMSTGAGDVCTECKAPLDAEPEASAPVALKFVEEPEAAPAPEAPPAAPEPPPFEAADDVKDKAAKLEAEITAKPDARALYLQLAQIYTQHGRTDLAVATLERALARDPQNTYLRHKLAQVTGVPEPRVDVGTFQAATVGTAVRPAAPAFAKGPLARLDRKHKLIAAGVAAAVVLAVVVKLVFFPGTRLLVSGPFAAQGAVWSPNGKHFAFLISSDKGTELAVYDLAAGSHTVVGPAGGWGESAFSWSPDGKQIAYTRAGGGEEDDWGGALHVYDLTTRQDRNLASASSPSFRAGGTILAVCGPERAAEPLSVGTDDEGMPIYVGTPAERDWRQRYCRIDAASGQVTRTAVAAEYGMSVSPLLDEVIYERWTDDAASAAAPAAPAGAPDQDVQDMADMATAGDSKNLAEASKNLGREVESRKYMEKRKAALTSEKLPPGGELLVSSVDRDSARTLAAAGQGGFATWTPAGDRILMATNGASGIEYVTVKPDGSDRQLVLSGVKGVDPSSVRLSADGRHVFFVALVAGDPGMARTMTGEDSPADLHVAEVGKGKPKRIENRHSYKQRYAVSPDGKKIVYEVLQDVKLIGGAGRSELWLTSR